eukprot:UN5024
MAGKPGCSPWPSPVFRGITQPEHPHGRESAMVSQALLRRLAGATPAAVLQPERSPNSGAKAIVGTGDLSEGSPPRWRRPCPCKQSPRQCRPRLSCQSRLPREAFHCQGPARPSHPLADELPVQPLAAAQGASSPAGSAPAATAATATLPMIGGKGCPSLIPAPRILPFE